MKKKYIINSIVFLLLLAFVGCNDEQINSTTDGDDEDVVILPENMLPQININTNGSAIVDEPKINATLTITEGTTETFTGNIGIEIRGSSSQMFPKKGYGFETRDEANEDLDVSLLNMPEEEDWILHAPYSDKSLLRNILIYDLSRDIGRYASRTKLVEVNINNNYNGVYVFMEKLKRDSNRIALNKLREDEISGEDLTGGYIIKIDKAGSSNNFVYNASNSFPSNYSPNGANMGQQINFLYEYPKKDDITPEQKVYISEYISAFETALASDDFTDSNLGYANYIDVDSFIDFFLLNEISNNVDGFRLSTWVTKDKNEKLKMGPIWDFNLAFGNANYCDGGSTNVWAYKFNSRCPGDFWLLPFWWERLLEDPNFANQLKQRWSDLRANTFSESNILAKIDTYDAQLTNAGSIDTNFEKWPVLGGYVWPNNFIGDSHDEEVIYMKNWISDRLIWLDDAISGF